MIGSDTDVQEARFRLHRIGYDNPAGYLEGGVAAWTEARMPVNTVKLVVPRDLHDQMQQGTAPVLVDVRLPKEWMALRISENLLNIPIDRLAVESPQLDPRMPVLTICNSAYRSSMGASVLLKAGFKDVRNLEGGSEAWINAGLPAYSAKGKAEKAPKAVVYVNLPERISPSDSGPAVDGSAGLDRRGGHPARMAVLRIPDPRIVQCRRRRGHAQSELSGRQAAARHCLPGWKRIRRSRGLPGLQDPAADQVPRRRREPLLG